MREVHAGLEVMREPAVGGARAAAVGTDVAGDVADAPVATLPLVVQRRASRREPLRLHLVGPAIDRELVLPAGLQHVGQPAGTAEVEVGTRSEEHTSELQSLMRISYAVFCLKKKTKKK